MDTLMRCVECEVAVKVLGAVQECCEEGNFSDFFSKVDLSFMFVS